MTTHGGREGPPTRLSSSCPLGLCLQQLLLHKNPTVFAAAAVAARAPSPHTESQHSGKGAKKDTVCPHLRYWRCSSCSYHYCSTLGAAAAKERPTALLGVAGSQWLRRQLRLLLLLLTWHGAAIETPQQLGCPELLSAAEGHLSLMQLSLSNLVQRHSWCYCWCFCCSWTL